MSRAVQFAEFGSPDVLKVVDVGTPEPGPGQVRVRVQAAGINPFDYKVFRGTPLAHMIGITPPAGVGTEFAGVVDALGEGVTGWTVGDVVAGRSAPGALATYVLAAPQALVAVPEGVDVQTAGGLPGAGVTAVSTVAALALTGDDVVLVSAAAGGVGVLAAQLARRAGATVIGTASEGNHDYLRSLGVIPVAYGDGLVERVRAAAPGPVTAVLDNHGRETIDAGLALGVPAHRINTIVDPPYAAEVGATTVGAAEAPADALATVLDLVSAGDLRLPIDSTFPLDRVAEAYRKLEAGHLRGKIVITEL